MYHYHFQLVEGVPLRTKDEVDLRIIVIVYDRSTSVLKCLESLQELELDGDRAVIDVFLDRGKDKVIHLPTLRAVSEFKWRKGPVTVHQHKEHVGIAGNWIDTWQPRANSSEIAIILEDDIDLSRYAYRWLKAAYKKYGRLPYIGGFSLHEGTIPGMGRLPDELVFLHAIIGTHAFSPVAEHWHDFRLWYHKRRKNPYFHPYVDANPIPTQWFREFEKQNNHDSMWEQWYIRFAHDNDLFNVYPNLQRHSYVNSLKMVEADTYLAYHRQETGLHFDSQGRPTEGHLINRWSEHFTEFPNELKKYYFSGEQIEYVDKH